MSTMSGRLKRTLMMIGVSVFCMGMVTGCGAIRENGLNGTDDTKDEMNVETEPDTEVDGISALSGLVSLENGIATGADEEAGGRQL